MFARKLNDSVIKTAQKMPVIALLGPRQSGKTTLARLLFPQYEYISLENYEERELAQNDPRKLIEMIDQSSGMILDEIQHVPQLLSYIQTYVDEKHRPGKIILTGSQNILVNQSISQSLAGRVGLFTLLPFSIDELKNNALTPTPIEALIVKGSYPRIYAYDLDPTRWYLDYIETYVERDVRTIGNINDLSTFRRFIKVCAARSGQLLNIASLASDCAIDQRTAKSWLSILEASYIIYLLQPYHTNFNKRVIKTPKLYMYDTGLACALLGIQTGEQLDSHYARGALIETLIIGDIIKYHYNSGLRPHGVYFWRSHTGHEVDCLIEQGGHITPVEIKASKTITSGFFDGITYWNELANQQEVTGYIIYGGDKNQNRTQGTIISWQNIDTLFSS